MRKSWRAWVRSTSEKLVASLALACAHATPTQPLEGAGPGGRILPSAFQEVRASARNNGNSAVCALVDVVAPGAAQVWVEHGDTNAYGERTRNVSVPSSGTVVVPIIGLTPAATTHFRVHAIGPRGEARQTADLTIDAPPLPEGVPASIRVTTLPRTSSGFFLVGLFNRSTLHNVAAMIDRQGRVRWYWVSPTAAEKPEQVDRVRGNFLVNDGGAEQFYEIDLAAEKVKTWRNTAAAGGLNVREFVLLPNGNALMLGREYHVVDSRPLGKGGVAHAIRVDHTVDEIEPDGKAAFHWSTFDHIGLDEILGEPGLDAARFESAHANAIEPWPDGNLLVSFRATSSIMKVERSSGKVLWRLGGRKSDFTFPADPMGGFSRQHDPRLSKDGTLMVFDNGNDHVPQASRVVRYRLDESAQTATMIWEYRHEPDIFSRVAGSARSLSNGNVVVGFSVGVITEVDEAKHVVWEAETAPFEFYRAIWVPSLYP